MDRPNIRHNIIPIIWSSLNFDFGEIKRYIIKIKEILLIYEFSFHLLFEPTFFHSFFIKNFFKSKEMFFFKIM